MRPIYRFAPLAGVLALGACTYGIVLDSGGQQVRTAWNGDVSGCRDVGKVTVSVLSRVGPVDRNDIKVRDELEIMARNQAAQMRADTIVPLGEPREGEQAWEGYACRTVMPPPGYHYVPPATDREPLPPPGYHYVPPVNQREPPSGYPPPPAAYPAGSGAPVEDVPAYNATPPPAYSPPPSTYAPPPQPPPFGPPVPAEGGAQTYPISGSSD